jgi:Fructosamine-3-kinase
MTMTVPHYKSVREALSGISGSKAELAKSRRIAGGDINEAYGLTLTDGTQIFMKSNRKENLSFFQTEVSGLNALAQTGAIGTPEILCTGTDEEGAGKSFLMLGFIEPGQRIPDYWAVFARELAAMHQAGTADFVLGGKFGFAADNYIGSGTQRNTVHTGWIDFYRDSRLVPQFERASRYFGVAEEKRIDRLLAHLGDRLVEPEHPSLLHGDLWSGNVMTGPDGKAWLIDPAAYVGHAEADLAMTELFGGFPSVFYDVYREAAPLQPGYDERRDLYHLYHLLNHLNLFGRGYFSSVKNIIDRYW